MKIIVEPETEEEKKEWKKEVFENVKEFFVFGKLLKEKIAVEDFHRRKGSFKFLIGNSYFFLKELEEEQRRSKK